MSDGADGMDRISSQRLALLQCALAAALLPVAMILVVLVARRLSGSLIEPLDFFPALAVGVLLASGTWLLRGAALVSMAQATSRRQLVNVITAATWLFVFAITLASMPLLAILALWLPLIAAEIAWQVLPLRPTQIAEATEPTISEQPRDSLSPGVTQQLTRTSTGDTESIRGIAQIHFRPDEQTAALHLAFCPPLACDPQIEVEVLDNELITVRATECRSYGVRLEAKRGRNAGEAMTATIQFSAVARA